MSQMGGEDFVVRVRTAFDGASLTQQARQAMQGLRREIESMDSINLFDTKTLQSNLATLRAELGRLTQEQVKSAQLLKDAGKIYDPVTGRQERVNGVAALRQGVAGVTPSGASDQTLARLRLYIAEIERALTAQRSRLQVGGDTGGFATEADRQKALAQSNLKVGLASGQLERLEQRQAEEIAKSVDAEVRQRSLMDSVGRKTAVNMDGLAQQFRARQEAEALAQRKSQEADGRAILALQRRAEIEQKAADAQARRQANLTAADEFVNSYRAPFANPDLTTREGRAQSSYNAALLAEQAAHERLAKELDSETRTVESVRAAMRSVENASRASAIAQDRVRVAGATGGSLVDQFVTGFKGESNKPYAEQIGQAFKFSVFYGTAYKLLFALTQTFQDTLQEGIEFQQAVTELKLATGQAKDHAEDLAKNLGQESVAAGFAPSQGAQIGARAVGLYGVSQSDAAIQDRVAELSTRVVSRLSFSSGMQPADLQESLAAIANAFGGGYESQQHVADLDAYFSHKFGTTPGGTIQTVAESGSAGAGAGFSLEEVSAMAALLQGRTGQSSPAVAGYLAQIFSRGGEGSLTALTGKYGIDSTQSLAEQIRQLAHIFQTADKNDQSQISAAFGRGKVQNAVVALLNGFDEVEAAAGQSKTGAAGSLDKAFNERLDNLGGQIQLTGATFKEFANELGQSGLLDVIGASVVLGREMLQAGSNVLELWSELPRPLRDTALALTALAVAARLGAAERVGMFGINAATTGASSGLLGRAAVGIAGSGTTGAVAAGGLAALANPVTLAIGGLLAIGAIKGSIDNLHRAADGATDLLDNGLGTQASSSDLTNRADDLQARAEDVRRANTSFGGRFVNTFLHFNPTRGTDLYGETLQEAARLRGLAETKAQAESTAGTTGANRASLITAFDSQSLSDTMDTLTKSGASASERFRVLADAIDGGAAAAKRAAAAFDPAAFASENASGIAGALRGVTPDRNPYMPEGYGQDPKVDSDAFRKRLSPTALQKAVADSLRKRGVQSEADLNDQSAGQVADDVLGGVDLGKVVPNATKADLDAYRKKLHDTLVKQLLAGAQEVKDVITQTHTLTADELTSAISQINTQSQAATGGLAQSDFTGRIRQAKARVRLIREAIRHAGGNAGSQAYEDLGAAQRDLADEQFNQLEAQRKAAQQAAHTSGGVRAAGMRALRQEIAIAVKSNDPDLLAKILAQAGAGAQAIARSAIDSALATAKAAAGVFIQQQVTYNHAAAVAAQIAEIHGSDPTNLPQAPQATNPTPDLSGLTQALQNSVHTVGPNVYEDGSDKPGFKTIDKGALAKARYLLARDVTDPLVQARAELVGAIAKQAQDRHDGAGADTLAQDAVAIREAQAGVRDAKNDLARARWLLARDITDPLVQARADLVAALRKQRQDRARGAGASTLATDALDVKQARADAEAAAFNQRLQDMQTADDLGRISHQKYLQYLQHEHDRLTAVKHRTRQQQEELDQIDQLMKEAANSMQGQWNFGDIQLPKPYQIRRYIEDQAGAASAQTLGVSARASTTTVTNTFIINGADTAKVRSIIDDYVGKDARTTTTAPRRK